MREHSTEEESVIEKVIIWTMMGWRWGEDKTQNVTLISLLFIKSGKLNAMTLINVQMKEWHFEYIFKHYVSEKIIQGQL